MPEEYYKKIAELIFRRVEKEISFDNSFAENIVAITREYLNVKREIVIVEIEDTPSQLDLTKFVNSSNDTVYSYTFGNYKIIVINKTKIEKSTPSFIDLQGYDILFYQYLNLTRMILKEIQKIYQLEHFKEEKSNTLQEEILEMSYFKYLLLFQKYYNSSKRVGERKIEKQLLQYYEISRRFQLIAPKERFASIFSFETILEISKLLELEKISDIIKIELCNTLLNPYSMVGFYTSNDNQSNLSPTLFYLEKLALTKKEKKIIKSFAKQTRNIEEETRLKLGLTLTPKEMKKIRRIQKDIKNPIK